MINIPKKNAHHYEYPLPDGLMSTWVWPSLLVVAIALVLIAGAYLNSCTQSSSASALESTTPSHPGPMGGTKMQRKKSRDTLPSGTKSRRRKRVMACSSRSWGTRVTQDCGSPTTCFFTRSMNAPWALRG